MLIIVRLLLTIANFRIYYFVIYSVNKYKPHKLQTFLVVSHDMLKLFFESVETKEEKVQKENLFLYQYICSNEI